MSAPRTEIITGALAAHRQLSGAIVVQLARSIAGTRKEAHESLDRAIALAREIVTRIELAQTLFAATPLEEKPPVDSGQWTGRHG